MSRYRVVGSCLGREGIKLSPAMAQFKEESDKSIFPNLNPNEFKFNQPAELDIKPL